VFENPTFVPFIKNFATFYLNSAVQFTPNTSRGFFSADFYENVEKLFTFLLL
jgi:hypothetical protein